MASDSTVQRSRLSAVALELLPAVVVVFAAFVVLASVSRTPWEGLLLYNGDSLILPLLQKSVAEGSAIHFVFSSQVFLFPEAPLYLASSAFAATPQTALLVNAVINVVLLYVVLRVIAHFLAHHSRHRLVEIIIALAATLLFLVLVLLEPAAVVNLDALATPLLSTTYYFGVILSGLAVIAMTLWVSRTFGRLAWTRSRTIVYLCVAGGISALTTFSNPLFLFQIVAPYSAACLVLVFCARLSWRRFAVLVGGLAAGAAVGMAFRQVFASLFPITLSNYLSLSGIPTSIRQLLGAVGNMLATSQGSLRLLILVGLILLAWGFAVFALYAQVRARLSRRLGTDQVFLALFITIMSIALPVGMVMTGAPTTRYLEPLSVFPLLGVIALGVSVLRRLLLRVPTSALRRNLRGFVLGVVTVSSVAVVVLGSLSIPSVARMATGVDYDDADCLDDFLSGSDANGVGSFWVTRPLELYGNHAGDVLQVDPDFTPFQWMINLGSYEDKVFSYVVTDGVTFAAGDQLEASLGAPARLIQCGGYDIYDYRGTEGEDVLTGLVSDGVRAALG